MSLAAMSFGLSPALEQAKIEKAVTMHGLRHTYASMLILLKPITAVSEYLGRADVSTTMRVYAHFLKEKKQDTTSVSNGSFGTARRKLVGTIRHSLTLEEKIEL